MRGTSLFYASRCDNINIAKCLVKHGANINKKNRISETPIFYAC